MFARRKTSFLSAVVVLLALLINASLVSTQARDDLYRVQARDGARGNTLKTKVDGQRGSIPKRIEVPQGTYTAAEIAALERVPSDPSKSTRTPPPRRRGESLSNRLTIVLDFKEVGQGTTVDIDQTGVADFNLESYGFSPSQRQMVIDAVLDSVRRDYYDELVGTVAGPPGQRLAIDFIVGDIGTPPPGLGNYYYLQVGSWFEGSNGFSLGVACLGCIRDASGQGPSLSLDVGDIVGSVLTDNILTLDVTPSDALTTGSVEFTASAIARTISHEVAHTVSLDHTYQDSVQVIPGTSPIMGTGAPPFGQPDQDRLENGSFSLSGLSYDILTNSNFPIAHVQQLKDAVGLEVTTGAELAIAGRVLSRDGRGITNAQISVTGANLSTPVMTLTGRNGKFTVDGLTGGETYVISVRSRRFTFRVPNRVVTLTDNVTDADFVAD